jgi:hypothetical protein
VQHSKVSCVGNAGNMVGIGFSGEVYRGKLEDGRLVAIKRQSNSTRQEYLRALEIHSRLSHANIVSLIGYCVENTKLILVYDFIQKRTLRDHLHGRRTRHRNPYLVGESSKSLSSCYHRLSACFYQTNDIWIASDT